VRAPRRRTSARPGVPSRQRRVSAAQPHLGSEKLGDGPRSLSSLREASLIEDGWAAEVSSQRHVGRVAAASVDYRGTCGKGVCDGRGGWLRSGRRLTARAWVSTPGCGFRVVGAVRPLLGDGPSPSAAGSSLAAVPRRLSRARSSAPARASRGGRTHFRDFGVAPASGLDLDRGAGRTLRLSGQPGR
jgi:hypothetical protein